MSRASVGVRKTVVAVSVFVAVWSLPQASKAAFNDGNTLLRDCSNNSPNLAFGMCAGYIAGIADAMATCDDPIMGWHYQMPKGVTLEQMVKVVTKWLNDHPEKLHYQAPGLVAEALSDTWPCP